MNKTGKDDAVAFEKIRCVSDLDQLTPWNPQVKKKYDRRFMLRLRFHPLSLKKPDSLHDRNDIKEIVLQECLHEQKCCMCTSSLNQSKRIPLSDSNAPEMNNAETVQMEVVFGVVPREVILNQERKKGDEYNFISSQLLLYLEKWTVLEKGKKVPVQTSMSNCDQWTPQNPNGKKKYERDFLLKRHSHPLSLKKPEGLYNGVTAIRDSIKHSNCHVCNLENSLDPFSAVRFISRRCDFLLL